MAILSPSLTGSAWKSVRSPPSCASVPGFTTGADSPSEPAGFSGPFAGRNHEFLERGAVKVRIPNLHEGDIDVGFLRRLLRQAGVSDEEWEGAR
jgi:hypothetical protein